jgi:isoleucyl-tRNA synthetase
VKLIDVWFDSGSMPYAQWHYPLKTKIKWTNKNFPADFVQKVSIKRVVGFTCPYYWNLSFL